MCARRADRKRSRASWLLARRITQTQLDCRVSASSTSTRRGASCACAARTYSMARLSSTSSPVREAVHLFFARNQTGWCGTDKPDSLRADVPYCDAFPDAKSGWLDELEQDMKAPDALSYYPPPAHLMHAIEEAKGRDAADDSATCDANGQGNDQGQKTCEQRCQTAGEPTGQ